MFTQGRRLQVRREILEAVDLCERKRAWIETDSDLGLFGCDTPLALALKTLVVGAEAVDAASTALPTEMVHRICNFV